MIRLDVDADKRGHNIEQCRKQGILLPTFKQMTNPDTIPESIKTRLGDVGLWDINPLNLFRITWNNEPTEKGGGFNGPNYLEIPSELSGVPARIIALVGKWFPTGAHKVGATYGCLAPALVTGQYDSTTQKAVWPSTGNYCRGGAYNSALLGCDSIAILPEEMSEERFNWLSQIAGEVIATPGCESNVKEIFDKCHELTRERGDDIAIFNQFEEFGNYLWHYSVTGKAIEAAAAAASVSPSSMKGYISSTGSGGTIAAGDYLKQIYPDLRIGAAEALQCPTLLQNGFGAHRIEGIGDKHVPWIHNVKNTDMVVAVDDTDCMEVLRLFNEPEGVSYLKKTGIGDELAQNLPLLGISGIGNLLGAIKFAKYYELDKRDTVFTILTDSMELYGSRIEEMRTDLGAYTAEGAAVSYSASLQGQRTDSMLELTYLEKKRVHNLKYYTWIEQQGRTLDELNAQWFDRDYWPRIQSLADPIDNLIEDFNRDILA
ncbi:MAG: pyridoxal-phosphate dependent enzyme [Spirochaetales bacterium]|jgi:cysteine synthase|nr:pyridoxal-phosphate dependent enzyme [Spirochaetales bacterium]